VEDRNTARLASAARRTQLGQIRAKVRAQLADSQLRRREVSRALGALRRGLVEFRSGLRTELREIGAAAARKKTAPPVAPPSTSPDEGSRCKP
jgi:hypothetical protein